MKLYSVTNTAEMLGVSRQYVHQLISKGRIKPVDSDAKFYMISEDEISKYMCEG